MGRVVPSLALGSAGGGEPPELVRASEGYMCRSLSRSLSGTKVKGSLTAWEKVEQCEITLIQRFLPHTSPMNP